MSPQGFHSRKDLYLDRLASAGRYVRAHLNFYRVHILFFTFTPLIASGIFYASNGEYHISYVDALFNCVSAVTVCGLATVDLSSLTPWQQVILFILMCMGSPVVVSWVMVFVRREIFASKFRHVVETEIARRVAQKVHEPVEVHLVPWWRRAAHVLFRTGKRTPSAEPAVSGTPSDASAREREKERGRPVSHKLRPDMIRRMNDAPKLVNPSGFISEGHSPHLPSSATPPSTPVIPPGQAGADFDQMLQVVTEEAEHEALQQQVNYSGSETSEDSIAREKKHQRSQSNGEPNHLSPPADRPQFPRLRQLNGGEDAMPRTQTIEFALSPRPDREADGDRPHQSPFNPQMSPRSRRMSLPRAGSVPRTVTIGTMPRTTTMPRTGTLPWTATSHTHRSVRTKHRGFGGFPMPHELVSRAVDRLFPSLKRTLTRTVTIPRTQTIMSNRAPTIAPGAVTVPYISFEAVVGRNSAFQELTRDQLEELGGVEYRALSALLWIVGGYHLGLQLLAFTVIAPYMSISRWHKDFVPPTLHRPVSSTWYSLFQVVSAYTNTGMSLEDTSLVPFQRAYPMIIILVLLILAGNTAFPIFLRFMIWIISKLVPKRSRLNETLQFLLDHPRRCFIYLFPSHQTWFLFTVLIMLNVTDWFFFLVLDIGNPAIADIPVGVRVIIGLLQATAVRAAGFGTVALSALAPAVKVLYVIMMYVSIYPIAMSVRSTNVYEEKSLGVFADDTSSVDEEEFAHTGSRATIWSRYLAMHMRKQLSFDMWWLGLALFLVCIIERNHIDNPDNYSWFDIFTILFELVSAYGTVGLSLGVPYANYSFSGALHPLSKLIICVVMLRGRHRGLPVAIDRAVILPFEFRGVAHDDDGAGDETQYAAEPTEPDRRSSRGSTYANDTPVDDRVGGEKVQRRSWRSSSNESRTPERTTNMNV